MKLDQASSRDNTVLDPERTARLARDIDAAFIRYIGRPDVAECLRALATHFGSEPVAIAGMARIGFIAKLVARALERGDDERDDLPRIVEMFLVGHHVVGSHVLDDLLAGPHAVPAEEATAALIDFFLRRPQTSPLEVRLHS